MKTAIYHLEGNYIGNSSIQQKTCNNRPPLFFLYGGSAQKAISEHLDRGQKMIGIDYAGRDGRRIPHKSVSDFANSHIKQILEIQPEGPFVLAGFSFGGLIAYEMGQKLIQQGHQVLNVMLLDTIAPNPVTKKINRKVKPDVTIRNSFLTRIRREIKTIIIRTYQFKFIGDPNFLLDTVCHFFFMARISLPWKRLRTHAILRVWRSTRNDYIVRPYKGNVTYFLAEESQPDHKLSTKLWEVMTKGNIDLITIPGKHMDIIQEPCVKILARRIQAQIDRFSVSP